jgi:hypothetical protein
VNATEATCSPALLDGFRRLDRGVIMQSRNFMVVCLAAVGLSAMSCGSEGSGECGPGRACPVSCNADSDCAAAQDEVCSSQLCGQRRPTSIEYTRCSLDADCSRGDHCSLGACTHDCLADRECTGGTVCSSRGRCIAADDATKPAPVVPPADAKPAISIGGELAGTGASLDFGTRLTKLAFTLGNTGEQAFDFRLLSSRAWLSASPYEGSVAPGEDVEITVTLDRERASADGGQGAFIAVNTSAGYLRVDAVVATELTGAWAGSLHVMDPVDLGEQQLVVNLKQVGSVLVGFVDKERSPLYPVASAVSGTIFPGPDDDVVSFGFDLAAAGGSDWNPALPQVVVRHFSFNGKREGGSKLVGTFQESFEGIRDDLQSALHGDAVFTVSGEFPEGGVPDSDPGLAITQAGNPMLDSAGRPKAPYRSCTDPRGPDAYLYASGAIAFYDAFYQAAHAGSWYADIQGCVAGTAQCLPPYVLGNLRCAQFLAASRQASDPTVYGAYLLDTLEITADFALYLGNAYVARAMDTWYDPLAPLQSEIDDLAKAELVFVRGVHSPIKTATNPAADFPGDGYTALTGPVSLLDPFFVRVVAQMPAAPLGAGGASSKLVAAGDNPRYRRAGEPVRRALRALESALFAASERADRQRRIGKDAAAALSVRQAAVRTWIDLGALAPPFSASGTIWKDEIAAIRAALREATRRYRDIQQGRNLFGYAPRYVPFLWSSTSEGSTNYRQIKQNADSNLATWKEAYASAAGRAFELSAEDLVGDLEKQVWVMNVELGDICGGDVTDIDQCPTDVNDPQPRSQIGQQALEVLAADLRIDSVDQQIANVYTSVEYERQRARDNAAADEEEFAFVLENGEKIYADDEAIRQIEAAERAAHSLFGGFIGGSWFSAAMGIAGAAGEEVAAQAIEKYEHDKARRIALQNARPYRLAATIELRNSQAKMLTDLLQVYTLSFDKAIAAINRQQAIGRLKALHAGADALLSERARVKALTDQKAAYLLHYRVFASAKQREAAAAFESALRWSYLTARAAEYQQTATFPGWSKLWGVRDPGALNIVLGDIQNWTFWSQQAQKNKDVISVRDDILGMKLAVKDETTGEEISPGVRFRRFVADPANRDEHGNFHIRFSTNDLQNPVFSSQVCSDRIQAISANLIGDSLGAGVTNAYVKLVQGGTTFLRACARGEDGTAPLIEYDMTANGNGPATARVYAAVNAPLDSTTAFVPNVELQERAVLASSWELVFDLSDQGNGALNLLGLDDIQLVFGHESYTIQ